jgi:hypothetical protein
LVSYNFYCNEAVTMKRPLSPFLTAVGVLVAFESVNGSIFGRSVSAVPQRWTVGMRSKHSAAFGLARTPARGGAVQEATEEEKDGGEPVELYLPGLLEVTISQMAKVGETVDSFMCFFLPFLQRLSFVSFMLLSLSLSLSLSEV